MAYFLFALLTFFPLQVAEISTFYYVNGTICLKSEGDHFYENKNN
ncbi:hypothetical protein ACOSJ1_CBNAJBGD_01059 [Enterococcus faecium]|nr:hypothetical protein OIU_04462 [Enterococcus faecium EnGen0039]ELB60796.1 hypothetical protein OKQ_04267 [Enterococcus faecium EnGen0052]CAH2248765.1 hypothetical protein ACOSJ1_CBNAJBGD_01059 [Enterococcus faecium]CAH2255833.1 hypothetical protein ACOSJ1_MOIKCCMD_00985 [Enterococcus faecium]